MSAAIFGNVSSMMLRVYQGTEDYREMLTSIREFIRFHFIPKPLATRLVQSYQHTRAYTHGVDMNSVRPASLLRACALIILTQLLLLLLLHCVSKNFTPFLFAL